MRKWLKWAFTRLKILILLLALAMLFERSIETNTTVNERLLSALRLHEAKTFNFVEWELQALVSKAGQELFGFQVYIPEDERNAILLDYLAIQRQLFALESQIGANTEGLPDILAERDRLQAELSERQALAEHIIEGQVSAVLQDEGFTMLGQVWPPVTMRFLDIPDVLVVSPRDEIRQISTIVLQPLDFARLVELENGLANHVPDLSLYITRIGGVGLWPSMIRETDRAVRAFEVTAHEWVHHYLIFYPLGLNYFAGDETRIINETTATIVGDEVGNLVIERFYAEELAQGLVESQPIPDFRVLLAEVEGGVVTALNLTLDGWNPVPFGRDYDATRQTTRATVDYLQSIGQTDAAQMWLDTQARHNALLGDAPPSDQTAPRSYTDNNRWIHHTRVTTDYLLMLGNVEAAEWVMENGRQHTGRRVLNQAWFAFNAGYQANPVVQQQPDGTAAIVTSGGGGNVIGAAIYEIRARSESLKAFLETMRGITTQTELLAELERIRSE